MKGAVMVSEWFPYAIAAAILYGLHQIFTKLAAERIGDGIGALIVETSAVVTILGYLMILYASRRWSQTATTPGVLYSVATGLCVGLGTIAFFLLFQRGGPLSAVPGILAGGGALMAIAGIAWFGEPARPERLLGIVLALTGLYLVR
jgi:bacterial/archaeal transporter family protein